MRSKLVAGVMPVAILPYTSELAVDWTDFRRQIDHVIRTGCHGVVMGQVSEVSRLTARERFDVAAVLAEQVGDRGVSVMSTGGESIAQALEFSRQAQSAGCDALLVMHPSMPALGDEEMYRYFASVIEAVDVPVIVHHAKSFARTPLSIDVQARLLHAFGPDKVLFKPEAAPTPPRVSQLMQATDGRARIFEGDGGMMLVDTYQRGVAGVIPATETAEITLALWNALERGDTRTARTLGYQVAYLMCHMMTSIDGYLQISKHLLHRRGLIERTLSRPPYDFSVDPATLTEATAVYESLLASASAELQEAAAQ